MRVSHLTWLLSRRGGGIPPVVFALAAAQSAQGHSADVTGVADPPWPALGDGKALAARGPLALGYAPAMAASLESNPPDLLHLHGLFTWPSQVARAFGRRTRRSVLVSPHGMLDPWALANSAWKKRVFRFLIEDDNLRRAACLHALCEPEAAQIRRLGFKNPVAIVPNGVELPDEDATPTAFLERFPRVRGRRVALFLGRIHPKKGLLHLVDAWATVKRDRRGMREWMLVVAGPDQRGHQGAVAARVAHHDLVDDVEFTGPLHDDVKTSAFAAASAFVLPSFSEGLSLAILEAMASRLPVLVTRQCNIDVEAFGGGLLADPTAASIARQLSAFLDLGEDERRQMGARGRREVEARYTWSRVAHDLVDAYGFVLGHNARPAFVEAGA